MSQDNKISPALSVLLGCKEYGQMSAVRQHNVEMSELHKRAITPRPTLSKEQTRRLKQQERLKSRKEENF